MSRCLFILSSLSTDVSSHASLVPIFTAHQQFTPSPMHSRVVNISLPVCVPVPDELWALSKLHCLPFVVQTNGHKVEPKYRKSFPASMLYRKPLWRASKQEPIRLESTCQFKDLTASQQKHESLVHRDVRVKVLVSDQTLLPH